MHSSGMTTPIDTRWWSARKAATYLGCSRASLVKWATAGDVPGFQTPGGHWRFNPAELEQWVESRRVKAS